MRLSLLAFGLGLGLVCCDGSSGLPQAQGPLSPETVKKVLPDRIFDGPRKGPVVVRQQDSVATEVVAEYANQDGRTILIEIWVYGSRNAHIVAKTLEENRRFVGQQQVREIQYRGHPAVMGTQGVGLTLYVAGKAIIRVLSTWSRCHGEDNLRALLDQLQLSRIE